jgi:hypothetical protein
MKHIRQHVAQRKKIECLGVKGWGSKLKYFGGMGGAEKLECLWGLHPINYAEYATSVQFLINFKAKTVISLKKKKTRTIQTIPLCKFHRKSTTTTSIFVET